MTTNVPNVHTSNMTSIPPSGTVPQNIANPVKRSSTASSTSSLNGLKINTSSEFLDAEKLSFHRDIDTSEHQTSCPGSSISSNQLLSRSFISLGNLPTPLLESSDGFKHFDHHNHSQPNLISSGNSKLIPKKKLQTASRRIISDYKHNNNIKITTSNNRNFSYPENTSEFRFKSPFLQNDRENFSSKGEKPAKEKPSSSNIENFQYLGDASPETVNSCTYEIKSTTSNNILTYKELNQIGKGTFSTVVLAESLSAPISRIAIKINKIPKTARSSSSTRAYYKDVLSREIQILIKLSHPSIIAIIGFKDFTTESNENYIALPYCANGNLLEYAMNHRDQLQGFPKLIQRIVGELMAGISYLHRMNYIHRDIKLENILINEIPTRFLNNAEILLCEEQQNENWQNCVTPLIKISDFSLSKKIDPEKPNLTTRCGSDDYVAPEILLSDESGYDGRISDVWSIGVCVFTLLEFRLPFDYFVPPTSDAMSGSKGSYNSSIISKKQTRKATAQRIITIDYKWAIMKDLSETCLPRYHQFQGAVSLTEKCLSKKDVRLKLFDEFKNDGHGHCPKGIRYIMDVLPEFFVDL